MTDFVLFFKQKTAYELRISDWSSDVCSSDLHVEQSGRSAHACGLLGGVGRQERLQGLVDRERAARLGMQVDRRPPAASGEDRVASPGHARRSAGRNAARERLPPEPAARRDIDSETSREKGYKSGYI